MAINYTWEITAMKKAPILGDLTDVITHVNFIYTGTSDATDSDGNNPVGTFSGACPIGSPDADNFTALGELTEADVIAWVQANHPVEHMQEVITKQINNQLTPSNVEAELPWAPPAEEETPPAE